MFASLLDPECAIAVWSMVIRKHILRNKFQNCQPFAFSNWSLKHIRSFSFYRKMIIEGKIDTSSLKTEKQENRKCCTLSKIVPKKYSFFWTYLLWKLCRETRTNIQKPVLKRVHYLKITSGEIPNLTETSNGETEVMYWMKIIRWISSWVFVIYEGQFIDDHIRESHMLIYHQLFFMEVFHCSF